MTTASPIDVRRARIRDLEHLADRVTTELETERAALARITTHPPPPPAPANPSTATIREWARLNGWPDLSTIGRLPSEVADTYHRHHQTGPHRR